MNEVDKIYSNSIFHECQVENLSKYFNDSDPKPL